MQELPITPVITAVSIKELQEKRNPEHHEELRRNNLEIVKQAIADSVSPDTHIIQQINTIDDLNRICNTMAKRLREWHGYYFPELSYRIADHEVYVRTVLRAEKTQLMKEYDMTISMGPEFSKEELEPLLQFAREIDGLYAFRENLRESLEKIMQQYCPNVLALSGVMIGAKLIEKAGSLKHLSELPSSTIQLLGAEKALFRHLRNKLSKCPKYGYILSHSFVMGSRDKGKAARLLASKISIASKVDYFKGAYIADSLKENLDKIRV